MCFGGRDKGDDAGNARSRELDKAIRADEKRMSKEVKLLLLGANPSQAVAIGFPHAGGRRLTLRVNRSRRIWEIDSPKTDEAYLCARVQQEREDGMEARRVHKYCPVVPANFRCHERAGDQVRKPRQ
jgi:hypothetical protein